MGRVGVVVKKSSKRVSFEAACREAGLKYRYLKPGVALMDDPGTVGEEKRAAIVRLLPRGATVRRRDAGIFLFFLERNCGGTYTYSDESGFVPVSVTRLLRIQSGGTDWEAERVEEVVPDAVARSVPEPEARPSWDPPAPRTWGVAPPGQHLFGRAEPGRTPAEILAEIMEKEPYGMYRVQRARDGSLGIGSLWLKPCCRTPLVKYMVHAFDGACEVMEEFRGRTGECCDEFMRFSHGPDGACRARAVGAGGR